MQSQYDGYKIDPIMIISQHPLARCCNEVARASVSRAARGHLVWTHRPPRPSQAPRPPARRGRAAVTTNLGEKQSIFSQHTNISLLLSRLGCILCCLASEASEVSEAGFHRHMWVWSRQHRKASDRATYPAWRRQRTQGGTRHHTVLRGQNYLESPPVA